MSRYVIVTAIQSFRMRYAVEVPDDVEEELYFKDGTRSFPCTPEEWAMDTVTCHEAKEFTQEDMGEMIIDAEVKTLPEILNQFRKEEPAFGEAWDDEIIIKNTITPIGWDEKERIEKEEERWKNV